jgi:hypothetical protein
VLCRIWGENWRGNIECVRLIARQRAVAWRCRLFLDDREFRITHLRTARRLTLLPRTDSHFLRFVPKRSCRVVRFVVLVLRYFCPVKSPAWKKDVCLLVFQVSPYLFDSFYFGCYITHSLTHGAEPFLRSRQLCSCSRTSQHFMEPGYITILKLRTINCSLYIHYGRSWDSEVGMATVYGLDSRGFGVRFPAEARDFSLLHSFQTISGAHPASYPVAGCFPGYRAPGAWGWPPPASAEVNNGGFILPFPHTPSWRGA